MWWVVSIALTMLCPQERTPGTHWIAGWVGLRAALDTEATAKILSLWRGSNPSCLVVQSVVRYYTDWATPAPSIKMAMIITRHTFINIIPYGPESHNKWSPTLTLLLYSYHIQYRQVCTWTLFTQTGLNRSIQTQDLISNNAFPNQLSPSSHQPSILSRYTY
jgi:hypothetical protein